MANLLETLSGTPQVVESGQTRLPSDFAIQNLQQELAQPSYVPETGGGLAMALLGQAIRGKQLREMESQKEAAMGEADTSLIGALQGAEGAPTLQEALLSHPTYKDAAITSMLKDSSKRDEFFAGTSMDAQAMNTYLMSLPEEQREGAMLDLVKQRLTKERRFSTPTGVDIIPGYTLPDTAGGAEVPPAGEAKQTKTHPEQIKYNEEWAEGKGIYDSLANYRDVVKEIGPQFAIGPLNAEDEQKLLTAYKQAQLDLKSPKAFALGVLAGPDMGILEDFLPDPTTLMAQLKRGAIEEGAEGAVDYMVSKLKATNERFAGSEFVDIEGLPKSRKDKGDPLTIEYLGQMYTFPDKDSLNEFKKAAKID